MNSESYSNFIGSGVANLAFGALLAFIIWLKRRIRVSKCKTNCHWFECESQFAELEHVKREVNTQRGMLQDVLSMLGALQADPISQDDFKDVILTTPIIKRPNPAEV